MIINRKNTICGILILITVMAPFITGNQDNKPDIDLFTNQPNFILGDEEVNEINSLREKSENERIQLDNYNISQWQSFFDNEFASVMNALKIPGMALSVVNSTNILYNKGYGYASLEESKLIDPNTTLFRIGSVSKLFTWTAVMQLYEQGLLDLDEDVNTYLSTFKIKNKFNQPITMRHLITHSAGFEADWIWNGDATEETLLSLEDYVIKFQPRRVSPPGETCSYSNYGASLAGYIVTQISGLDYDNYIEENIFIPL
ncbi:MAG: serine hydrolase, partial [Candidatus Heimdallarchaeota archaeon]|nr:serine hydrolase [Candidatus Heimdallarchaeota archaeon]MCK4954938.1 serine hydrolase [Candidatus Heimdallarchaeota archaeon]